MNDLKIKSYVKKRSYFFISNNYELLNIEDDLNLIIYYLRSNKIKIILRKFNDSKINGWKKQLVLKIYDINNKHHEIIVIGTSNKNWKILNYKTKIEIKKKEFIPLNIPKKIFQTYKNNEFHNIHHYNAYQNLIEFNPDFEYYFYNDIECRKFIIEHYDHEILNAYDKLYPCAYKADLFRYLIMYKFGGVYLDNKYILRNTLYSILDSNDRNVYCYDKKINCILNSILISKAGEKKYDLIIKRIIDNIKNNFFGECPLHPTGPRLFYEYFYQDNIKLKHKVNEPITNYQNCVISYNSNILLNTFYDGYYFNKNHRNKLKNDYDFCYRKGLIYLQDFFYVKNYKFSILIENQIHFQVLIVKELQNKILVQLIIKNINFINQLKKSHKLIFINNENHDYQEFDLIDVWNKIFEIEI